jgi:hypothetical protein
MTPAGAEFPFVARDSGRGAVSLAPVLPFTLVGSRALAVEGLLDTGAAVNVLPYSVGEQLGVPWDGPHPTLQLSGNLASCEAKGILLSAVVGSFAPVQLVGAWAKTDDVPLLLGQVNFFQEFDVCFYRSRGVFQLRPKQTGNGRE